MSTQHQRFAFVLTVALAAVPLALGQPDAGSKQPAPLPEGLRHVPADALGFAHVRVADFLASDAGKAVLAQLMKNKEVAGALEKVASDIGMSIRDVESITLIVQAPTFNREGTATKAAEVDLIQRLHQQQQRAEDFRDQAEAERRRAEAAAQQAEQDLRRLNALKKEAESKVKPDSKPECNDGLVQEEDVAHPKGIAHSEAVAHPTVAVAFSERWLAPMVIVTANKAFERKKLLRFVEQNEQHENNGLIFLSDRSILIGSAQRLVHYVDRISKDGSKATGPLTRALTLGAEKKYVLVAGSHVPGAVRQFLLSNLDDHHGHPPGGLAMLYPLAALESMALAVDLGSPIAAKVQFYGANPKSVNLALEGAKSLLARAQIELEDRLADDPPFEGNKLLIDFLGDLSKALQVAETEQNGNVGTLTLRLDLPATKLALAAQLLGGQVQLSGRRLESANNLKQIALAMHNYHDVYGGFPPAGIGNVAAKDGKPLLSWRVAILPFIEQEVLYRQFDLNLPWDHPKNKRLIAQMPAIYAAPGLKSKEPGLTHYQVFVGPGTPFELLPGKAPGNVGRRLTHIPDGTSNTLMVVEAGEPVIWTKPDDLPYDQAKPLPKLGGLFPDGFNVAFCDGSVRFISNKVKEQSLRILITGNDGMVVPEDVFQESNRRIGRPTTGKKSAVDVPATPAPESKESDAPKQQPEGRGARLSGRLTAKGQPLPRGQILLRNDKDVFEAAIQADGTYQFANLPNGEYRVAIRQAPQAPARFAEFETSALVIRLRPAVNFINFDLQ